MMLFFFFAGMNSAVRAVVRMGIYVGCKVFLIREVSTFMITMIILRKAEKLEPLDVNCMY